MVHSVPNQPTNVGSDWHHHDAAIIMHTHLVLDVHQVLESLDMAALSRCYSAAGVLRLHLPTEQEHYWTIHLCGSVMTGAWSAGRAVRRAHLARAALHLLHPHAHILQVL